MIPIKFYNTETKRKEELKPLEGTHVTMYTCGPTVYNFAHIGNFRTYVFEDLLRRTIKFCGYTITQVMNLTDVDDKTIKGAIAKGVTLNEFTQKYKDAFFDDLKTLNIEPAEKYPAATDYIQEMISLIQGLIEKGIAYRGGDESIYYAISKFSRYGCLSHLHLDELQVGASERVAEDEYEKESASDFVLWKKYDPERDGKIFWESPFGPGRPGWHLECSAMAMSLLGRTIDIHVGAVDNIFPHHENEIAQSEAFSGQRFVKHWMHSEHLIVDGRKMSKSLRNVYTLRDLLQKGFTNKQIRMMLIQTHYRTQLNFTFVGLEAAKQTLQRLNAFIERLFLVQNDKSTGIVSAILEKTNQKFVEALTDDLNISIALAAIFDMVREINILCDEYNFSKIDAIQTLELLKRFDTVLGVLEFDQNHEEIPHDLQEALEKRIQARSEKNWKLADTYRNYINERGYQIEDIPGGSRLKKN